MHAPIPHSAWLMNTFMIGVGVIMIVFNGIVQGLGGAVLRRMHQPGRDIYREFLTVAHTQEYLDSPPAQELLLLVKNAGADALNVYRYCCLALSSYIAIIVLIVLMLVVYSIPNQIFLMRHLAHSFPNTHPEIKRKGDGFWSDVQLLCRVGLPRNLKSSSYSAFSMTWMMVMIGHSQSLLLLVGVLAFSIPPFYLFFVPWYNAFHGRSAEHQITFIIAYTMSIGFLTAFISTGLAATLTFDDIFRAVSGIGQSYSHGEMNTAVKHLSISADAGKLGVRGHLGIHSLLPHIDQGKLSPMTDSSFNDSFYSAPSSTTSHSPVLSLPQISSTHSSAQEAEGHKSVASFDLEANATSLVITKPTSVQLDRFDQLSPVNNSMPLHRHLEKGSPPLSPPPFSFLGRHRAGHS